MNTLDLFLTVFIIFILLVAYAAVKSSRYGKRQDDINIINYQKRNDTKGGTK